jgi:secreted Zn-dependent insulinase-like peptidase
MIISNNETRQFHPGELKNGIRYCAVQDTKLDRSHVVVSVNVGHLADPIEFQGLAHFLEHMLFLGSEKYPKTDYFDSFTSRNGGMNNAYTSRLHTNYNFSILNEKLEKALDIFSQFFKKPLFNDKYIKKELNAIDSEHKKNIYNDFDRLFRLIQKISLEESQLNKFGTGNFESLNKKGVKDAMIDFYKKYYQPENITVLVASNMDLKNQVEIIQKNFSDIESNGQDYEFKIKKPFFKEDREIYYLQSISKPQSVCFLWEIPEVFKYYLNTHSPYNLMEYLRTYQMESLKVYLIDNKLIHDLICDVFDVGMFLIYIDLVDLKYWKIVESHLKYFFSELAKLNWDKNIEIIKNKEYIRFNYSTKIESETLTDMLAINLHNYPLEEIYSGSMLTTKFDLEQINELLNNFLTFDKVKIILISNSNIIENIKDKIKTEPYYNLQYFRISNEENKLKEFPLSLNLKDKFNNFNATVIKNLGKNEPDRIEENVWFGSTSKFNETKVYLKISLINPELKNKKKFIVNMILINFINEMFQRFLNFENDIGISFSIVNNIILNGFDINFVCYNQYFTQVLKECLEFLHDLKIEEKNKNILEILKESMRTNIFDLFYLLPWEYINEEFDKQIYPFYISPEEALKILNSIEIDDIFNNFDKLKRKLLNESQRIIFGFGNYEKDDFENDLDLINKYVKSTYKPIIEKGYLSSSSIYHPNKKETNKVLSVIFHLGNFEPSLVVKGKLLSQILNQKFYNFIRTNKQYGYLVGVSLEEINQNLYFIEKVQTEKSLEELEKDIESFNINILEDLKEKDFNEFKESYNKLLKEKSHTIKDVYLFYLKEILLRRYLFRKKKLFLRELEKITWEDFIDFYKENILNNKSIKIKVLTNDN